MLKQFFQQQRVQKMLYWIYCYLQFVWIQYDLSAQNWDKLA